MSPASHPPPPTVAIPTIIIAIIANITRAPSFEEPQNFRNGTPQNFWNHHLGVNPLQCTFNTANAASRRVSEKVGFRVESTRARIEPEATERMRTAGDRTSDKSTMAVLFPEDRPSLPW